MPELCRFYGIIIKMYFYDNERHNEPHFHAEYGEHEASFRLTDGEVIAGFIPITQRKLVQAWIEIHRGELKKAWKLAVSGHKPFKIEPLR